MTLSGVLLLLALLCIGVGVVSGIRITALLERQGVPTPFPLIGLFMIRNVSRYRELTLRETGRVGPLFYGYVVPFLAALILVLVALVVRGAQW